ncbi:MAG: polysaccharide biosynthesis C-terminal domain-containing protein [Acutalibacteraceae bacterium]
MGGHRGAVAARCCSSASSRTHRGFFQGQSNMTPTSVSQVYEAMIRVVFGLGGAYLMLKKTGSLIYAAAGGIFGVTAGCIVAVVYLRIQFGKSNQILRQGGGEAKSTRQTMKELLVIAIPITLGSAGLQIINLFDTMIYMRRLTGALAWSSDAADTAKGIYNFCQTIFNLPCSLITPITISIIPTVTAALTKGNTAGARHTEESAVRTMSLIAMPCAVGLGRAVGADHPSACARNLRPRERHATAAPILAYLGIAVIFNSTVLLFNAIMQAHGDVTTPVVNMLIGGVVKVVVNYILVAIPSLNIIGAAIGTIVCYVTITVLDLIAMRRSVTTRPAIFRNVIRPAAAAGIMGAATFFAAALLRSFTDSNTVVCLGALIAAVVVYVIFVVVLRCITYEDCMLLPKGEKIAKILHIKQKT